MSLIEAQLEALDPDLVRNDLAAVLYRRVTGGFEIDEWGLDPDLVGLVAPLARLRWSVRIEGESVLPEIGPALIVHNRRFGMSEPAVLAAAVREATGRTVRPLGGPAVGPLTGVFRRLGVVSAHLADLRSLLRAGELAAVGLGREPLHARHAPQVPLGPIAQALDAGAPIVPVAVMGFEPGRCWTVRVGRPIATRRRRATGEPTELADATRAGLQHLLTSSHR